MKKEDYISKLPDVAGLAIATMNNAVNAGVNGMCVVGHNGVGGVVFGGDPRKLAIAVATCVTQKMNVSDEVRTMLVETVAMIAYRGGWKILDDISEVIAKAKLLAKITAEKGGVN